MVFVLLGTTFAYTPTSGDQWLISAFANKLDQIRKDDSAKFDKLKKLLPLLLIQVKEEKSKYIFQSLIDHIEGKTSNTEQTNLKTYVVTKVTDGDTIQVEMDGEKVNIRMIGIDAPESTTARYGYVECFGKEASDHLKTTLNGESVSLEFDTTQGQTDKYGRLLAYVFSNGKNINQQMIADGYAWEYTYDMPYKYKTQFQDAELDAEEVESGLRAKNACRGERKAIESEPATVPDNTGTSSYSCSAKKYCTQMITCEEAMYYLNSCGLSKLDADGDGVPCESICS